MALKPSDSASESSTEASRAATQGAAAAPKPTPRAEAPLAVEVGSSVPGPPPLQTPLPRVSGALSRGQCLEAPTNLQDGREALPSSSAPWSQWSSRDGSLALDGAAGPSEGEQPRGPLCNGFGPSGSSQDGVPGLLQRRQRLGTPGKRRSPGPAPDLPPHSLGRGSGRGFREPPSST